MTEPTRAMTLRTIAWGKASRRTRARALGSRDWVHAILERYVRRFARAAGGDRVFARPLTLVRDHWFVTARRLFPSIHLAIRPLLRPRLWQVHTTLATSSARTVPRSAESARGRAPSVREFTRTERVLARVPLNGEPLPGEPRRATRSPLATVFQRLRDPEHAIGVAPGRAPALFEQRPELVHRFADRSRRVEHSPADAPSRVIARRATDAVDSPSRHGRPLAESHDGRSWAAAGVDAPASGSRRRPAVPQEPPVNIAALADRVMQQIDDRLHAWHERTGF